MDSASAQSGARLSEALYSELVRQIEAETARQEAARQQANWQAQFDYQKQQDADALQYQLAQMQAAADKQGASNAWDLAQLMLKNGVVPDAGTLSMAGIDPGSAQALADSYRAQLAARQRTGGGSSGGSGKPRLSESAVLKAIEEGRVTDDVITAYDYYYGGGAYQQYYGGGPSRENGDVKTFLGYDEDEGTLTWNGKIYGDLNSLVRDMDTAGLSDAQLNTLKKKAKDYGFTLS